MRKSTSGFTIVEIIIAIVVIAILATIGVAVYGEMRKRIYDTAVDAAFHQAEKAIRAFDTMTTNERFRLLDPEGIDTNINGKLRELNLYDTKPVAAGSGAAPHAPEGFDRYSVSIHWCGESKYLMYTAAHSGVTEKVINDKIRDCYRPSNASFGGRIFMTTPGSPLFKYRKIDLNNELW